MLQRMSYVAHMLFIYVVCTPLGARARLGEAGVFAVLVDNVVHALCLRLCLSTLPPFPMLERAQYRVAQWGSSVPVGGGGR